MKTHHLALLFSDHPRRVSQIDRMGCAVSKMLESSTKNIGGREVGTCLMMRLSVGANGSLMNSLDSMRRRISRKGGPLFVSYVATLQQEIAYLQTLVMEQGARD